MLNGFPIPDVAREAFQKQGFQNSGLTEGVDMFLAHDKGTSYRFYIHPIYNKQKSTIAKYERFDDVIMIEWFVDKRNKPVEQVRFLPPELLALDEGGQPIGGKYAEAYGRWLSGVKTPGLPLSKWGVLSDSDVATLASGGVFSVEQFASLPRAKVVGKYHTEIIEAFERAIQYVAGKIQSVDRDALSDEMLALHKANSEKDRAIEELQAQMKALLSKKKGGRPRKSKETETNLGE